MCKCVVCENRDVHDTYDNEREYIITEDEEE